MEQEIRSLLAKAARARQFADMLGSDRAAANLRSYATDLEGRAVALMKLQDSEHPATPPPDKEKP